MSTTVDAPTRRVPARVLWLPLVVVLAAAGVGAALVVSVWDQLPDPVAQHWGADGRPDGWSPRSQALAFAAGFSALFPLLLLGLGAAIRLERAIAPLVAGLGVFLSSLTFGMLHAQRGLADAAQAVDDGAPLWSGVLGGVAVGVLVWLMTRDTSRHVAERGPAVDAPHLEVASGTRVAWTGRTRSGVGLVAAMLVGLLPTSVMAVVFFGAGNASLGSLMVVLTLALVVLLSALRCRVSVDVRGVRAVGVGVVPWVRIPLAEIEEARVEDGGQPLGDWGGWGYRGRTDGSGSWGLITAAGDALVLRRAGKGPFYLTVGDPAAAAAVVNTLLLRRDGASRPGGEVSAPVP